MSSYEPTTQNGPRPLVICGPSGSGKSTLLKKLFDQYPSTFGFSISHTTRQPRPGEEHGLHYYFTSKDDMERKIAENEFVETAVFSGHIYGTSKGAIKQIQNTGKVCILDIELQGVQQIKKTNLDPIFIFTNPPSMEELEDRLRKRNTETEDSLARRLQRAEMEIAYGLYPGNFHKVIHNYDVEKAYQDMQEFILSELKAQEEAGILINWK